MKISSPAFEDGAMIPSDYTCDADNINPPFVISDIPEGTKSLALIMDDPDAPRGTFTHWLMWNMPSDTKAIDENDWLEGAEQGLNDGGELGYMGPCPPEGAHHYHFKLYALDSMLNLPGDVSKEKLEKAIEEKVIEKAELVGMYKMEP